MIVLNIEKRKSLQDKLILLNGKELDEVDTFIEGLFERRRRAVDIVRECE